ncbi:MAG: biotin transporter BioY [Christensenellaceae bacterium]|nr:biotin transporter BioY [Christensenellaceae bacterium]
MKATRTKSLVLCALFAALTAVCSQIQIPLGVIPVNLALFSVHLCALLMKKHYAALSMTVYLLMGLAGLPVFTGFQGGAGVLFGRTGGYIIGYVASAFLTALIVEKWGRAWWQAALAIVAGVAACYLFGTLWFMALTKSPLWLSLTYCVFPFLPGDAVKLALAVALASRLERPLRNVMV